MKYVTKSPKQTQQLAGFLLNKFLKTTRKYALVFALEGELGAGKTTFVQGLARALHIKAKIKSPTFNLMKKHKILDSRFSILASDFYHLDCYRLRDHRDLLLLGIKDILDNPKNIVLIEWSDRVKKILPKRHIKIHIDHINTNTRNIRIEM